MKINIQVKTNKKESRVEKIDNGLIVWTTKSPHDGEANKDIQKIVSNFFNVPKKSVTIVKGLKSKNKIIEIDK